MRGAAEQLSALIAQTVDLSPRDADASANLRHELRTPLNAIKGYGELLVEALYESGSDTLLTDFGNVLDLADRLLGEIDHIVETAAAPSLDIVGSVLQTIQPLDEVDITDARAASSYILVVDDNLSNRDLLSRRLMREGYRVTAVENGETALEATADDSFDLVLLDMMMPGLSGFEVLCRLKADARTRHVPVIMISALDELDSAVRCIAGGAEDYLPKPFNPVVLRARVGASLEKKRLLDRKRAIGVIAPQHFAAFGRRAHASARGGHCRPDSRGDGSVFRSRRFYCGIGKSRARGDCEAPWRSILAIR